MILFWKIAAKNILRNSRRSLATGSAITAGFVGLTLLGGYINSVHNSLKANTIYINHVGHLSVYRRDATEQFYIRPQKFQLTPDDLMKINQVLEPYRNQIELTSTYISGMGLISNGTKSIPFFATGVDPETERKLRSHPFVLYWARDWVKNEGNVNLKSEGAKYPDSVSITARMGELIGQDPPFNLLSDEKRSVQLAARSYAGELNAVNATLSVEHTTGVDLAEDTSLIAPLKLLQELFDTDGVQYLAIYMLPEFPVHDLLKRIQNDFETKKLNYQIFSFDDEAVSQIYVGTMSFLFTMAGFFIFLICGAVSLSIINAMTMGILERVKEIGTLRAIGYESSIVSKLFVREAVILTGFCLIAGVIVAESIAFVVNSLNIRFEPPAMAGDAQFSLTPTLQIYFVAAAAMLLLSAVTAFLAVRRKSKIKVIDLLTDTGA